MERCARTESRRSKRRTVPVPGPGDGREGGQSVALRLEGDQVKLTLFTAVLLVEQATSLSHRREREIQGCRKVSLAMILCLVKL